MVSLVAFVLAAEATYVAGSGDEATPVVEVLDPAALPRIHYDQQKPPRPRAESKDTLTPEPPEPIEPEEAPEEDITPEEAPPEEPEETPAPQTPPPKPPEER